MTEPSWLVLHLVVPAVPSFQKSESCDRSVILPEVAMEGFQKANPQNVLEAKTAPAG